MYNSKIASNGIQAESACAGDHAARVNMDHPADMSGKRKKPSSLIN
jgi:hypothetical protein